MSHVSVVAATVPDELLPEHEQTPGGPAVSPAQAPPVEPQQPAPREVTAEAEATFEPESAAAKLRARMARVQNREHRFPVPPLDVWGDDLVMVARPVELKRGMTLVALVAQMTVDMLWRDDDTGELESITEVDAPEFDRKARAGWLGVGEVAGIITPDTAARTSVGDVIGKVCGTEEVLGVFVQDLVAWIAGRRSEVAAALGE
jgi:hypothetical protein